MTRRVPTTFKSCSMLCACTLFLLLWVPVVSAASGPPVISESFTKLPCPANPKSTVDYEGCLEQKLLRSDRAINTQAAQIFQLLGSVSARAAFGFGERAWLTYRRRSCTAESSIYAGGTAKPLAFLRCSVNRNSTHQTELAELKRAIRH
jgi:uncharacterized protein YecT (DUF1311 family)